MLPERHPVEQQEHSEDEGRRSQLSAPRESSERKQPQHVPGHHPRERQQEQQRDPAGCMEPLNLPTQHEPTRHEQPRNQEQPQTTVSRSRRIRYTPAITSAIMRKSL